MSSLRVSVQRSQGLLHVHLHGVIDETANLGAVFDGLDGDAVFHLGGVERINSPGVLEWTRQFSAFTKKHQVRIEEVSYPMAMQANCVSNLFKRADVASCLAPYFCPRCKVTASMVVRAEDIERLNAVPDRSCTQCGGGLDFDELDTYFRFLRPFDSE